MCGRPLVLQACLFKASDNTLSNFTDAGSLYTTNVTYGVVDHNIVWQPQNGSASMMECPDVTGYTLKQLPALAFAFLLLCLYLVRRAYVFMLDTARATVATVVGIVDFPSGQQMGPYREPALDQPVVGWHAQRQSSPLHT